MRLFEIEKEAGGQTDGFTKERDGDTDGWRVRGTTGE